MAVRLERLLEDVPDQEIQLLAGAGGLQTPIRWVHMVEGIEISSFLEGGELAFVTGIALCPECTLEQLVQNIQAHGAGGAIINVGPYIPQIPQSVIDFCDERDFPLLSVPWHIHMAVIMKRFSEAILLSDRAQNEWTAALKNAVFHPNEEALYLPALESRGLRSGWSYCVALLEPETTEGMPACLRTVENCLTVHYPDVNFAGLNGQVVLLFANCTDERIEETVQAVLDACAAALPGTALYAGTGRATRSARCIAASWRLAQKVLLLQKRRNAAGRPACYRELGAYRLLMAVDDPELLREYTSALLGPLRASDSANGTDYIGFLRTWLDCDCSSQRTAERMFLHRNTVDYHLHRIAALLEVDLSTLDTRLQLSLALKALELC
ncbi:MAG: PucR family transcriptional regulator [Gemmiger sp.]